MRDDPDAWRSATERAAAHRRVPDRQLRQAPRPAHAVRPREAGRRGHADHPPRDQPHPARRLPAAAGAPQRRRGARAARGAAPAGAGQPDGLVGRPRPMSEPRSISRPCCPALTRSIPKAVARTVEPAEFSLLRLVLLRPYLRDGWSMTQRRGHRVREHAGARDLAALEATAIGWLRPRRRSSSRSTPPWPAWRARCSPIPSRCPRTTARCARRSTRACSRCAATGIDDEIGAKEFDIREAEASAADTSRRPSGSCARCSELKQRRLELDRRARGNNSSEPTTTKTPAAAARRPGGNG